MTTTLSIFVTNKCNLACDFCYNDEMMHDGTKARKDLDVVLEQHLIDNPNKYTEFLLTGGEPMINVTLLENLLSVMLSYSPESDIVIYTNGCYLTMDIAEALNQYPNITTVISIDRIKTAERGLLKLLENDFREGYGTVAAIKHLKRKGIKIVATPEDFKDFNFAMEAYLLHKAFGVQVNISLDKNESTLNAINVDDLYNIGEFIYRLVVLGVYHNDGVMFNNFFSVSCKGACGDGLKWDGTFTGACQLTSEYGCEAYRRKMKPGMYDLLHQLVNFNRYTFDAKLEDKPKYIPDVGYVGERKEHIPLRKQLQYEERVNYRYRHEQTNINIKEVQ